MFCSRHLILHHLYVLNRNVIIVNLNSIAEHIYRAELGIFHFRFGKVYAHGIILDSTCAIRVCRTSQVYLSAKKIIYKISRPIESGEKLYTSYM